MNTQYAARLSNTVTTLITALTAIVNGYGGPNFYRRTWGGSPRQ